MAAAIDAYKAVSPTSADKGSRNDPETVAWQARGGSQPQAGRCNQAMPAGRASAVRTTPRWGYARQRGGPRDGRGPSTDPRWPGISAGCQPACLERRHHGHRAGRHKCGLVCPGGWTPGGLRRSDALAAVAYSVVGALVVSRRPDNPPLCRGPDRLESVDGPLRSQQRAWRLLENRHGWSRGVNSF